MRRCRLRDLHDALVRREQSAVEAALRSPYSRAGTGLGTDKQAEDALKPQMYGRASFELLRRRFLGTA
jgi:transposase